MNKKKCTNEFCSCHWNNMSWEFYGIVERFNFDYCPYCGFILDIDDNQSLKDDSEAV